MSSRETTLTPQAGWGVALVRMVVGLVFFMHGLQKLTGGIDGVAGFFGSLGIPMPGISAVVVTFVELIGGLLLIVGLFTRLVSIPLAVTMVVAIVTVHLSKGFYAGEGGYEFPLVLLVSLIGLAIAGAGELSADSAIARRRGTVAGHRTVVA